MRILLVTEYSPYQTDIGSRQRSNFLWRSLQTAGEVDVLLLRQEAHVSMSAATDGRSIAEGTYRLLPLGLKKYTPDVELGRLLRGHLDLGSYDLICARYLGPISKLVLPADVPTIVDLDDIGYTYASGGPAVPRLTAALKARVKHFLEQRAVRRYSRFWFLSERDRARMPDLPGSVLPNIPIPPRTAPVFSSSGATILLVGALWYPPNKAGVERFLANCWPAIREKVPEARLRLVGQAPEAQRDIWNTYPGVEAPGFVPDLDAEYAGAAFTVAPIYFGGGSNIKVLESLAHGRTCVTTRFSLGGFVPNLNGRDDIIATAGDDEMTAECIRLLRDPVAREPLARHGNAVVTRVYGFEAFRSAVLAQVSAVRRSGDSAGAAPAS